MSAVDRAVAAWGASGGVDNHGGPPDDGGMEARVAKLEAAVEYILRDVGEMKGELKIMNQAVRKFGDDVNVEFKSLRSEAKADLHKTFAALVFVALGLAGIMAKGFGWV